MRISVIIPVLNREDLVQDAVNSVLAQTRDLGGELEVLVVDDGSADGSLAAALACGPRVRGFRHETSRGQSAARNTALREAAGEYVYLLDSDDLCAPGGLRAMLDALEAEPALGLVYGAMRVFRDLAELGSPLPPSAPVFAPGTSLVQRQLFDTDEVGLLDETLRSGECMDWYSRAQLRGRSHQALPTTVLHRRAHPGNMTHERRDVQAGYHQMIAAHLRRRRGAL